MLTSFAKRRVETSPRISSQNIFGGKGQGINALSNSYQKRNNPPGEVDRRDDDSGDGKAKKKIRKLAGSPRLKTDNVLITWGGETADEFASARPGTQLRVLIEKIAEDSLDRFRGVISVWDQTI